MLAAALLLAFASLGARAGDHDRARAAVRAGEVLPLGVVLERVARVEPGQVLEVELEREAGQWVYELKLLRADGQLLKLHVDARTAEPLRARPDAPQREREKR